jgi:antirestriction protein
MTHPITPPPELIEEWIEQFKGDHPIYVAIEVAKWGADQELEACCEWLQHDYPNIGADALRTARRPKPLSLKEQALKELQMAYDTSDISMVHLDTIRRALESIND